jgi:Ca2+-binding RTX toxin-like protein
MFVIEPTERRLLFSAVQTGTIVTVHGTPGNDVIQVWNNASDLMVQVNGSESSFSRDGLKLIRIYGERGDDVITAMPGSEPLNTRLSIDAGAGNDSIAGGAGNDTIIGNTGNDTIDGGAGENFADYRYVRVQIPWNNNGAPIAGITLSLSSGQAAEPDGYADLLRNIQGVLGSQYCDSITGTDGSDSILGSGGDDTIHGGDGDDYIRGGGGKDKLFGGSGNDTILGDVGQDLIYGNGGNDSLKGGNEEGDTFAQTDYDAGHVIDFQPGLDVLI